MADPFHSAPGKALHNLFFAIRPPAAEAERIRAEAETWGLGGRLMRADRLHVSTLSLLRYSATPDDLAEQAADVAAAVRAAPFRVIFDRLAANGTSAVLLSSEPLDMLRMFRERLGFTLLRGGVDIRLQGRFNPHVTVAYGSRAIAETEIDPVAWTVEDFVLIDSVVGETRHIEVGRWPLR